MVVTSYRPPLYRGDATANGFAVEVNGAGAAEPHAAAELAPVRSSSSRRYQRSGTSPSPSNLRVCPFTTSWMITV